MCLRVTVSPIHTSYVYPTLAAPDGHVNCETALKGLHGIESDLRQIFLKNKNPPSLMSVSVKETPASVPLNPS